ncbi:CoA transferase [Pseudonocardia nematodicida]|uniref:CoA transferase n=1 Tax=Pseudonocardia nematodicida TaxID=1206997 RepID=A0ABV1K6E0_9PSEU
MAQPSANGTAPGGALADLRIVDLTQVMAGPFCTMVLADLGADVIKVENPEEGDQTRRSWGRPAPGRDSRAFMALNRNKRSVTLDLKTADGVARLKDLVADADVVVENFRPGVAARLGVDHAALSAVNPALIYASISGFGQDGPYSSRPGYDLIAQAMGGVMSVTGEPDGRPVKCGLPLGDLGAGLFTAIGILSAWNWRRRSGEGQYLETSLFESVVALSVWESVEYWGTGNVPGPLGSAHRINAPYQALATKDGYVTVGANNQRLWRRMCEAIGEPELADDPRFATNMDRLENLPALVTHLEARLAEADTDTWVETLLDHGVPAGPIQDYRQVLDEDPHLAARGMVTQVEHPLEGIMKLVANPIRLTATPPDIRRHPPRLGEHVDEVLGARTGEAGA